ncbi:glycerophosphodiester phosphodiesterase family protein [Sabulilitoribacter arenilitoris]|uniref:Glycerophosphodiester phosphodiesterase family protein n=1 Tax=Wocania arenilitoris TaxID=2044858 RepID=A0AAE3EMA3_9FLAO|nr:glycerophosphodiester phosphodiesterase family protein [Wocania arenilitoris]MCF7567988.1 glycerophosphodiester phosphodiesterase family protein [Wocania arenilitoris]
MIKKIIKPLLLVVIMFQFQSCKKQVKNIEPSVSANVQTLDKIISNFKDSNRNDVIVVSHRGDWRNAPENSLQAIQNCIDMGVDMVEIDIHKTKDGKLVLMHDKTIDRTTTGKGLVSEWTLDSLKTLFLRNGANHPTHHKIPTLEEAMLLVKGKAMINLDKCYDYFDDAYSVLVKTGTEGQVVIKGNVTLSQVKEEFGEYLDKVLFMPVVVLDNPESEKIITDYLENFKPVAFEFVFKDESSTVLNSFKSIRERGSGIWVNSLWESLNAGYEDDMAVINPDSIYGWYVNKGVNIIQTDRPKLLLDYLRSKGLHN